MVQTRLVVPLLTLALCLAGAARTAAADKRRIYLNGIDLTDTEVTNKTFDACTVRFDDKGNIHITAKGLKVEKKPAAGAKSDSGKPAAKPVTAKTKLEKRYFLIGKESLRGGTQYDIAVRINGRQVTTIRSNGDTAAIDITRFVKPGDNELRLIATKRVEAKKNRRSTSAKVTLKIIIGEGTAKRGEVTLRKTILEYKRTAAETRPHSDVYRFRGR
jgi:hypothetical protein